MKLQSLDPHPGEVIFCGVITMLFLGALGYSVFVMFHYNFLWSILKGIGYTAAGLSVTWLVGHVTVAWISQYTWQCLCGYRYKYCWTELLHKQRCLAFRLNGPK